MRKRNKAGLKQILFMLVMLFLISLATGALQAAEGLKLVASENEGTGGELVSVIIRAENAAGSEGGQFILNFDPALIRPVSVEPGSLVTEAASGLHMVNLEYEAGQLMFMWVTVYADTADEGEICSIEFELLSEGETRLEFEDLIISPEDMEPATPVSGKITVGNLEVDQDEIGEDELEWEEDTEDDRAALNGSGQTNPSILVFMLLGLAVLAPAGFMILKRSKKGKH